MLRAYINLLSFHCYQAKYIKNSNLYQQFVHNGDSYNGHPNNGHKGVCYKMCFCEWRTTARHLNRENIVGYLNGNLNGSNIQTTILIAENKVSVIQIMVWIADFDDQTQLDHLNNRLVCFSDPHCITKPLIYGQSETNIQVRYPNCLVFRSQRLFKYWTLLGVNIWIKTLDT